MLSHRWACAYRSRRRGSATSTRGSTSSGFRIQRRAWRGTAGKQAVYTYPSKKALASVMDKVRTLTRRAKHRTLADLLRRLNPVLRGWCNYFRHGVSKRTFSYLDHFAFWRIVGWLRKRHLGLNWGTPRSAASCPVEDPRRPRPRCSGHERNGRPATATGAPSIPTPWRVPTGPRTSGMITWRAGCAETRTSGSEGGPGKRTSRKTGTALRSDPYTYLRTWEGWLYLAAVHDAFSRRIVGWSMADHMRHELVVDALQMALARRRPEAGLIHHSDQGGQYVSLGFGQAARDAGIARSMGSRGDCWDCDDVLAVLVA